MKTLIALALLIMATMTVQGQTQAPVLVDVQATSADGEMSYVGNLANVDNAKPHKRQCWCEFNVYNHFLRGTTMTEMTDAELLAYFRAKLAEREGRILLQVNEEHQSRLVLNANGTWSIVYE